MNGSIKALVAQGVMSICFDVTDVDRRQLYAGKLLQLYREVCQVVTDGETGVEWNCVRLNMLGARVNNVFVFEESFCEYILKKVECLFNLILK